jgi:hypothetical protein
MTSSTVQGECYKFTQIQMDSCQVKNGKNFNNADITERIAREPTSMKHSITCEISGGRIHLARCPPEWV